MPQQKKVLPFLPGSLLKPSYEFAYRPVFVCFARLAHKFPSVSDDVRVSLEEYLTRSRPIGKRARVAWYNNWPCCGVV